LWKYDFDRKASMGPPTISADQLDKLNRMWRAKRLLQWGRRRSRRINVSGPLWRQQLATSFNGAADDLGGSTERAVPALRRRYASMGPPTISADQRRAPIAACSSDVSLQW
ncbi:hypothetical protein BGP34_31750, partial [Bacillus mycoides]